MSALIEQAVALLKQGKLIGLPTETVYGLAADARNENAIRAVFAAKGRPADHPLIVHIGSLIELDQWAINIPDAAYQLAAHYWPGPLTLVLKKHPDVSPLITGGQDTIALRMPAHPLALALLGAFGHGLVAPSANRFGQISPTDEAAVEAELGSKVALILPGGRTSVGIESSIIALHEEPFVLLRQGMISLTDLAATLGKTIEAPSAHNTVRAPGLLASHYAPRTPLYIIEPETWRTQATTDSAIILARNPCPANLPAHLAWQHLPSTPEAYAHELYAALRAADNQGVKALWLEALPSTPEWSAIQDRVGRAATQV